VQEVRAVQGEFKRFERFGHWRDDEPLEPTENLSNVLAPPEPPERRRPIVLTAVIPNPKALWRYATRY
jgi:hypothetical protein